MTRRSIGLTIFLAFLVLFAAVFASSPAYLGNAWLSATGRGYFIPAESSFRDFLPVVMNQGSGEWWIYAEDSLRYYYAGDGVSPFPYVIMRKTDAGSCPGFRAGDFATWCAKEYPTGKGP